ncbi:MAG: class I SAM-dependent methyltransferase [Candidatus Binatia bacterium]
MTDAEALRSTEPERWEHQRRTFEHTAESYDRYRPRYPSELFRDMRTYASLRPGERVLEIGCGPGIATAPVAAWGHPMTCLEPAGEMVAVARRKLPAKAEFITTTFEDWEVEAGGFGLVYVAQAFHWLDRATRTERIRSALRPGGTAAVLWNEQVNPDAHSAFFVRVLDVYRRHAPALVHQGEFRTEPRAGHALGEAHGFVDHERKLYPWEWTLKTGEYVALMATHSPHAALPEDARSHLLDGIAQLIDAEFGGRVSESYFAVCDLARRGEERPA